MKTLIINIKQLVQVEQTPRTWVAGKDMAHIGTISDAWLLVEDDKIAGFGEMKDLDTEAIYAGGDTVKEIDATGRLVLPPIAIPIPTWFMLEVGRLNILIRYAGFHTKKSPNAVVESLIPPNVFAKRQRMSYTKQLSGV